MTKITWAMMDERQISYSPQHHSGAFHILYTAGTWLAPSVEPVTLNLKVVCSSLMLGPEPTEKNKTKKNHVLTGISNYCL